MKPPINGDIRLALRQAVFILLAFLFMMTVIASSILIYMYCNPTVWADNVTSRYDHRPANNQHITTPVLQAMTLYRTIWAAQETALLAMPGVGPEVAHIGLHFPLTLRGYPGWMAGTLWYPVQWSTPTRTTDGWVSAAAVTFTAPVKMRARASLDVLMPQITADFASLHSDVGVVVYDVTHQRYYSYQGQRQFISASSIKVPIMLAFLDLVEQQKREPNDQEMAQLAAMIENSDNDAASALYFNELGGAAGMTRFLQRYNVSGLIPSAPSWGYSRITPLVMVKLLTLLQQGNILTASHRALAFFLMEHVEADQRVGVGDTAPAGTTVAMKNGWVPGPDGLWAVNTSGIVMGKNETYIIAVYTQEQSSLAAGQAITQKICRAIASALIPSP